MTNVLPDFPEDLPGDPFLDPSAIVRTPSFAQIGWMKRNVQALGGTMLAGVCRPKGIAYPADDGVRTIMVNTTGCGNETLALIPRPEGEAAKICLVCDGGIEWPRLYGEEATGGAPPPPEGAGPTSGAYWVGRPPG